MADNAAPHVQLGCASCCRHLATQRKQLMSSGRSVADTAWRNNFCTSARKSPQGAGGVRVPVSLYRC